MSAFEVLLSVLALFLVSVSLLVPFFRNESSNTLLWNSLFFLGLGFWFISWICRKIKDRNFKTAPAQDFEDQRKYMREAAQMEIPPELREILKDALHGPTSECITINEADEIFMVLKEFDKRANHFKNCKHCQVILNDINRFIQASK